MNSSNVDDDVNDIKDLILNLAVIRTKGLSICRSDSIPCLRRKTQPLVNALLERSPTVHVYDMKECLDTFHGGLAR